MRGKSVFNHSDAIKSKEAAEQSDRPGPLFPEDLNFTDLRTVPDLIGIAIDPVEYRPVKRFRVGCRLTQADESVSYAEARSTIRILAEENNWGLLWAKTATFPDDAVEVTLFQTVAQGKVR